MLLIELAWKKRIATWVFAFAALGCQSSVDDSRDPNRMPPAAAPEELKGAEALATGFDWGAPLSAQRLPSGACRMGEPCPSVCENPALPYYCGYACAESRELCAPMHGDLLPTIAWFAPATGKLQRGERWSPDERSGHLRHFAIFSELPTHRVPEDLAESYDVERVPSIGVGHELFVELGIHFPAHGPERVFADIGIVAPAYVFGEEHTGRAAGDGCLVTTATFERTDSGPASALQSVRALIPPGCAKMARANAPLNFAVRFRVPGYEKLQGQTVTLPHRGQDADNFATQLASSSILNETVFQSGNPCFRESCPVFALVPGTLEGALAECDATSFPRLDEAANYTSLLLDPDPLTNAQGSVAVRTGNDGKSFCKEASEHPLTPLFTVRGAMVALGQGAEALSDKTSPLEVSFAEDPIELRYQLCPDSEARDEDCVTLPFKGHSRDGNGMLCLTAEGEPTGVTEPDVCLSHEGYVWRAMDPSAQSVRYLEKGYADEGTRFRHQLFLHGDENACEPLLARGFHDGRDLSLRLCATRPRLGFFNDQTLEYHSRICTSTPVSVVTDASAVEKSYGVSDSNLDESKHSGSLGAQFVTTASVGPRQVQTFTRAYSWLEPQKKGAKTMAALFYDKAKYRPVKHDTSHPESLADGVEQGLSGLKLYAAMATGWALPFVDIAGSVYTGTQQLGETPNFKDRTGENGEKQQSMRFYYGALGYLDMALDWQGELNEHEVWGKELVVDTVSIFGAVDALGMNPMCLTWHLWPFGYPGSISVCPWLRVGAYVKMDLDGVSREPDAESFFPEAYHSGNYTFDFGASVAAGVTLKLNALDVVVLRAGVAGELTAMNLKWGERTGMRWGIWDGAMHAHPLETAVGGAGRFRYLDGRAYVYIETPVIPLWQKDLWSFQGGGHEWEHLTHQARDAVIE